MPKIIPLPGLIHFEYQSRNSLTLHFGHDKSFRDFLKQKKIVVDHGGEFFRKGKDGINLDRAVGQILDWGNVKKFVTFKESLVKRK